MILPNALPNFKTFAKLLSLPTRAKPLLLGCLTAFLMHLGKMSATQAASAIRSQTRHRAQILRFLLRKYWQGNVLQDQLR